jgi:hypothetical protein
VADAGHDALRLALALAGLPVAVLGLMRSDRVLRRPAPPAQPSRRHVSRRALLVLPEPSPASHGAA